MNPSEPIDIGTRIEPFVDGVLIETLDDAEQRLHHPERREVVFVCDAPWESEVAGFNSLIQEGRRIRLYYRAATDRDRGEDYQSIAVAESTDGGFHFERPDFGLIEHDGSKGNNLIARGEMPLVPPAFLDTNPDCPSEQRYKGLCARWKKLYAMCSADGLRWRLMREEPLDMSGTFDTINTAFWDARIGAYRCFTRYFRNVGADAGEADLLGADTTAVRSIQSSKSDDFLRWSDPVPHGYRDEEDRTQLYTNATVPCPDAEHIYLSFPNRYVQHRVPDPDHGHPGVNDALFMCSRDARTWTRYLDAWVRPGLDPFNWTERNNYPTWGIVETSPNEWSMFISEHYRRRGVRPQLRRLSIRPHGFVSIHAGYSGGEFVTRLIRFDGDDLFINYATSAAGSVRVDVLGEDGRSIDGYRTEDMEPLYGDFLSAVVRWNGDRRIGRLAGRAVRLRFSLRDTDLYAIRTG